MWAYFGVLGEDDTKGQVLYAYCTLLMIQGMFRYVDAKRPS